MYKVGEKVRVRDDLRIDEGYDGAVFMRPMERYSGKVMTVSSASPLAYKLLEDNANWSWTESMLEPISEGVVKEADQVAHPSHYTKGKIEVIDFIQDKGLSFDKGNVVKYVVRAGHKPEGDAKKELEDLQKAKQYIDFAIRECEKKVYQNQEVCE